MTMRAGRYPEDHPLERWARDELRAKTFRDTPAGRVVTEAERALRLAPRPEPRQQQQRTGRKRW